MISKYILISHPRYGLCNKLINWAKAYVWAEQNNANLLVQGWTHFPLGSILRGDKSWRWYQGFFKSSSLLSILHLNLRNKIIISDLKAVCGKENYYEFKATPYISDFITLSPYRSQIKDAFFELIRRKHLRNINNIKSCDIGIHIRRGDFVKIGSAIDLDYYVQVIKYIRKIHISDLSVTIFTDGFAQELEPVLNLPKVSLFKSQNDLIDLIALSKSKILVTSLSSSYSYWAAFICDGIILHHPKTWVPQCRPKSINKNIFEGPIDINSQVPDLLSRNIKEI